MKQSMVFEVSRCWGPLIPCLAISPAGDRQCDSMFSLNAGDEDKSAGVSTTNVSCNQLVNNASKWQHQVFRDTDCSERACVPEGPEPSRIEANS